MTDHEPIPPHHGAARARVLKEVAPRVGQLRAQAALHPDAHVDVALVRETIALLQSLLPANPAADKQAQIDMANEHHARADRADHDQSNDLEAIRYALYTGLKSAAKTKAQEAFLRVTKRALDIGLLDAWARGPMAQYWRCWQTRFGWSCDLVEADGPQTTRAFADLTPSAARAAAASALREAP